MVAEFMYDHSIFKTKSRRSGLGFGLRNVVASMRWVLGKEGLSDYPKLFLVGSPRSGTTWVQSIFGCHPRVVTIAESHIYRLVFAPIVEHGCRGEQPWTTVLKTFRQKRDTNYPVGPHHYVNEREFERIIKRVRAKMQRNPSWTYEQAAHDVVKLILDHFYLRNGGSGRKLLVEKSPSHVFHASQILRRFPNARLVNILRDGRDVCVSLQMRRLKRSWPPQERKEQIDLWMRSVDAGLRTMSEPDFAGRVMTVRYEELKADPVAEISRLYAFAGLEFDKFEAARVADATDFKHLTNTGPGMHRRKGIVGDWRSHFTQEDHQLFKQMAGELFVRCGYRFDDVNAEAA